MTYYTLKEKGITTLFCLNKISIFSQTGTKQDLGRKTCSICATPKWTTKKGVPLCLKHSDRKWKMNRKHMDQPHYIYHLMELWFSNPIPINEQQVLLFHLIIVDVYYLIKFVSLLNANIIIKLSFFSNFTWHVVISSHTWDIVQ